MSEVNDISRRRVADFFARGSRQGASRTTRLSKPAKNQTGSRRNGRRKNRQPHPNNQRHRADSSQ